MNPNYVNLLDLLLTSIHLYGQVNKDTTDILIFTDTTLQPRIEAVARRLGLQLMYNYLTIHTKWEAASSRLKLFDYEHIHNYEKILYLDTDILINRDMNTLFKMSISDAKLYAIGEGHLMSHYWGGQFFDFNARKKLPSWGTEKFNDWSPGFCTGTLLFHNSIAIRDLFDKINRHIHQHIYVENKAPPDFWEQPFVVYNAVVEDKYDNVIMNKYACNSNYAPGGDYIIYHYPCGPGWYEQKFDIMTKIAKIQKERREPQAPLVGDKGKPVADWKHFLNPNCTEPYMYLDIGAAEGHSMVAFEHIYAVDPNSRLYGVDTWNNNAYITCLMNVQSTHRGEKFVLMKGSSRTEVPKLLDNYFDIVYINGKPESADVLENAVLAFPKLKVGGRIIFNNYSHGSSDAIKKAVDAFATIYSAKLKWCGMTHPQNLFTKTAD